MDIPIRLQDPMNWSRNLLLGHNLRLASFSNVKSLRVGLSLGVAILGIVAMLGSELAQASDDIFNLAWASAPRSIDPRYAVDADSQYLENLIHCSLIDFDTNGKTIPNLATSWEWTSPTQLKVVIKTSGKFADGSTVEVSDVIATLNSFNSESLEKPSPRKGAFAKVKGIKELKKDTLQIDLAEPDSTFVTNLVVGILPKALAQNSKMIDETKKILGCGPFKLTAMGPMNLTLARNPHFSLSKVPNLGRINIKIVKDESTRFSKLVAGEVDLVQNALSRDSVKDIASRHPGLQVVKRPGLNTAYLGFNMRDKIVGNVKVRQAIAHAIDKAKIIKYILHGLAIPAKTLIPPDDPYYDNSLTNLKLNVARAKSLLDEAGFKDPDGSGPKERVKLTYKTTTDITRIAIAKAIASDLKKVGISVTVQPLEWGRFKADVEAGKVQMWSLKWVGFKDPDIFRYVFSTESFPPNGGNRGWYSNKGLDALLSLGKTQTKTTDRTDTYKKVQKIVGEELPYVFLWHEEIFAVMNKKVHGFNLYADGRFASLKSTYIK